MHLIVKRLFGSILYIYEQVNGMYVKTGYSLPLLLSGLEMLVGRLLSENELWNKAGEPKLEMASECDLMLAPCPYTSFLRNRLYFCVILSACTCDGNVYYRNFFLQASSLIQVKIEIHSRVV